MNIFDVARYIVEEEDSLPSIKLQKLCYYSQAWALAWTDKPLFNEDFQAWKTGPICIELMNEIAGISEIHKEDITSENELSDEQKDTVNIVLQCYGKYDGKQLNDIACLETPFRETRTGDVIEKEKIKSYYKELQEKYAKEI